MEQIKKYWKYGVILVLILLLLHNCANNKEQELKGKNIQLKEQIKKQNESIIKQEKYREVLKDSISREIKKIKEKEENLEENNRNLQNKVVNLQNKLNTDKEKIKNLSKKSLADSINKRYNVNTTSSTDNSITAKDSVPNLIVSDLTEKDNLEKEVKIKDEIIENKDIIIDGKDSTIKMREKEIKEAEKTISLHVEKDKTQEEYKNNADKQIRKLKIKGTIKTILIPAVILGTILIIR